jgi:hypothetical protein
MLNHRTLAAAIVATGAGAVIFLSTGQESISPATPGAGPVPVAIPPAVTEIPSVHPAVPAAEHVPAPPTTTPTPSTQAAPKRQPAASAPTRKTAPKLKAIAPPTTSAPQQPQPGGTEPNGTGGWQLPACYAESCVAPQAQTRAAPASTQPSLLGSTLDTVAGVVAGLLTGRQG